jgi:uncharacterized protein involved in exopolysaccharide biosynthesis
MNATHPKPLTPRATWEVVLRHKKKVLLCPLLAAALGMIVLLYFPRTYRSQAQIFLRVGRESVGIDPTTDTGRTIGLQQIDRKDEIKSATEVLKSRGVLAQVVDIIGPAAILEGGDAVAAQRSWLGAIVAEPLRTLGNWWARIDPISDRERAVVKVERNLTVGAERGSTLIVVEFDAESPQLAQLVAGTIIDVFQKEHMRIHRNDESRPFFEEQQQRLREQLDGALEEVRRAKNEMGLADVAERRATLEAQFSAVELDRLSTRQQIASSHARVDDLKRQLREVPGQVTDMRRSIPNAGADLLRDQLYALQVKSMDLRARYSDAHPQVQAIQDQLREAEAVLAEQEEHRLETTDSVNPIHRQLSLDLRQEESVLAGHKARLSQLDQQRENVLTDQRALNQHDLIIDRLERQAALARSKYMQYATSMEEARMDMELQKEQIHNVSIAQAATLAERPVSPSKLLVVLATLLMATFGTAALVAGSEWINDRKCSMTEFERTLEMPDMGSSAPERLYRAPAAVGHGPSNGAGELA